MNYPGLPAVTGSEMQSVFLKQIDDCAGRCSDLGTSADRIADHGSLQCALHDPVYFPAGNPDSIYRNRKPNCSHCAGALWHNAHGAKYLCRIDFVGP